MALFDHLYIPAALLPISPEEAEIVKDDQVWQSQSLDCASRDVFITKDGKLEIRRFDLELVPKEERPYPDAEEGSFYSFAGSMREVNERMDVLTLTGTVTFYAPIWTSSVGEEWYEFDAYFEEGILQRIEGGKGDVEGNCCF